VIGVPSGFGPSWGLALPWSAAGNEDDGDDCGQGPPLHLPDGRSAGRDRAAAEE
jgi:hypothetical protein